MIQTPASLRILLAEDQPVNQQVALLMLEKLGYQADLANNGHEVLTALASNSYDVVLLDVEMPELDGLETARAIGADQTLCRRPYLIAVTAYGLWEDEEQCFQAGMNDYLSKPLFFAELETVLQTAQQWLQRTVPRDPAQAGFAHDEQPHRSGPPPLNPPWVREETDSLAPSLDPGEGWGKLVQSPLLRAVLDPTVVRSLRQMSNGKAQEILANIIADYLEDAPQRLQAIERAIATANPEALRQSAHALRSSSANLGAQRLSECCRVLETLGKAGTTIGTQAYTAPLEAEFWRVKTALQEEFGHPKASGLRVGSTE